MGPRSLSVATSVVPSNQSAGKLFFELEGEHEVSNCPCAEQGKRDSHEGGSRQSSDSRLFGQIGVSLKILSEEQVERLLTMQRFYRCLDHGAVRVFENRVSFSDLLASISRNFGGSGLTARHERMMQNPVPRHA